MRFIPFPREEGMCGGPNGVSACHGRSEARERVGFLRCWDRNLDMATGLRREKSARLQRRQTQGVYNA